MLRNKFKNTLKAFTAAELLIVMVFAGFILIYELVILNKKTNQYGAIYYNAYNTLRKVAYNVYADTYCPDPASEDEECKKGVRKFPENAKDLCLRFGEYLNIPEGNLHCDSAQTVNKKADNIGESTLMFKTANANRFYMSDKNEYTLGSEKIEYFVVYIDINGDRTPNKLKATDNDKVLPDIVPFIVTRKGEVAPAGLPIYSKAYLTAKIRYPIKQTGGNNCSDSDSEYANNKYDSICYYSESMNFNDAVHRAWGDEAPSEFVLSYPANQFLDSDNIAIKELTLPSNPAVESGDDKGCAEKLEDGSIKVTFSCKVVIDESDKVRL